MTARGEPPVETDGRGVATEVQRGHPHFDKAPPRRRLDMTTALDQLKQYTTVVADTGDFQQLAQFKPRDATTNPSLILKAVQKDDYKPLLEKTVKEHAGKPVDAVIDRC